MTDAAPPALTAAPNRRGFLQGLIAALSLGVFASAANVVVRFLMPTSKPRRSKELTIPTAQIPLGSYLQVEFKGLPVLVIHLESGFAAFDATCTHLGCIVKWVKEDKVFLCPCHAGKFDTAGRVLSGPPPEPLHKIDIEVREDTIVFT